MLSPRANNVSVTSREALRQTIAIALDRYDPETQCVVLVMHDETALFVRIIGVAGDPSNRHTPRAAYYREILDKAVAAGLPN